MTEKFLAICGLIAVSALAAFVLPLLGTLLGCFIGWVVGAFFPETFAGFFGALGLFMAPWQIGAMLGFIGGFFRVTVSRT